MASRQQQFTAGLAKMYSNKLRMLDQSPSSRTPVSGAPKAQYEHAQTTDDMSWLAPTEQCVARTIILDDATEAKHVAQYIVRENEAKVEA
jgi:hypothetical protein